MINTSLDIVYADPALPLLIAHDPVSMEVRFCLSKRVPKSSSDNDLNSVEDNRSVKQQLPSFIGASKVMIQTVHSERSVRPDGVLVTTGRDSSEVLVCLSFAASQQVHVYACSLQWIDKPHSFKRVTVFQNVTQMVCIQFSKTIEYDGAKLVSKELIKSLRLSKPFESSIAKHFRGRLYSQAKDLALLSQDC